MKIVHISTDDYGGAGLAVVRLHKALRGYGIDSNVLVRDHKSEVPGIYKAEEKNSGLQLMAIAVF